MSPGDIILVIILGVLVLLAVRHTVKNRGKCSGGCGGCVYRDGCHKKEKEDQRRPL